jgi:hypothetical protein
LTVAIAQLKICSAFKIESLTLRVIINFVMQKIIRRSFCVLAVLCAVQTLCAQGTAFMYQGRLNDGGSPATGNYDLRFQVFDAVTNGNAIGFPLTNSAVAVNNGLFATTLDFGAGIFTGTNYWLQIGVQTNGLTNAFVMLVPRQPILPVPYAIFANTASNLLGTLAATQLSGTLPSSAFAGYTNTVSLTNSANLFSGTFNGAFAGNGTNLVNLNASQLTGGTVADARLSSNVPLLNGNQTFSGANNLTNGNNSFVGSFFGNGLVGWIATNGASVQTAIDHGYLLLNPQVVTVTLPASANPGDIVRISGAGAGGWQIAQNSNQSILGNFSSFSNSLWEPGGAAALNWNSIASSADGTHLAAVAAAVTSGTGGIFISTDSGATWTGPNGDSSSPWRSIASSADGTRLVSVNASGGIGGIYTNSGTSWNKALSGAVNWSSVASSADGSKLAAAISNSTSGGIYTSANSGATWSQTVSTARNWVAVASSADGSKLAAAAYGGGIYTSANWSQATSAGNKSWTSIASSADGSRLAATVSGGFIYTSGDSGSTWVPDNVPAANWTSIASSADGSKLAAVANAGGIYLSSNGGATWTQTNPTNGAVWSCIASSADGSKLAATILGGGIYHSQASLQTATTTGASGYINGIQGSAVELQYIGNNQWMPVSLAGTIWAH